jgi:mRNA interferase MazF
LSYPVPVGVVLVAEFPEASPSGREQAGERPAVVVGMPDFVGTPVYPGLILVPFTTRLDKLAGRPQQLYPQYLPGVAGLTRPSAALVDQVRYVDQARLRTVLGRMTEAEFDPIRMALQTIFSLS